MIPKEINYILYGLDNNYNPKPFNFTYSHYLNILSAKVYNPDYKINLHCQFEPDSVFFKQAKELSNIIPINNIKYNIKFKHKEHIGDMLRLETLNRQGGIYLDLDVVCIKSFDILLNFKTVMGLEYGNGKLVGMCNAVIMSVDNSKFLNDWLNEYKTAYKGEWSYNSVVVPYMLASTGKYNISVQPQSSFFKYSWDNEGRKKILFENANVNDCYCLHLWDTKNKDILHKYDEKAVMQGNNTICNIYKKVIEASRNF